MARVQYPRSLRRLRFAFLEEPPVPDARFLESHHAVKAQCDPVHRFGAILMIGLAIHESLVERERLAGAAGRVVQLRGLPEQIAPVRFGRRERVDLEHRLRGGDQIPVRLDPRRDRNRLVGDLTKVDTVEPGPHREFHRATVRVRDPGKGLHANRGVASEPNREHGQIARDRHDLHLGRAAGDPRGVLHHPIRRPNGGGRGFFEHGRGERGVAPHHDGGIRELPDRDFRLTGDRGELSKSDPGRESLTSGHLGDREDAGESPLRRIELATRQMQSPQ